MLHTKKICRTLLLLAGLVTGITVNAAYPGDIDILALVKQEQIIKKEKIDAAFAAMETVQQAGAYIDALSDLFESGETALPVGIRKGDYDLIIREVLYNKETDKNRIYASCAFKFKESGQKIAFDGYADIEGQKGLGTSGALELITPVRRDMGNDLTLIFNKGTKVNFGCDGVESFYARMDLLADSVKIKPVDANGKFTGGWLSSSFEAYFDDFDNFSVTFAFNRSFGFAGLDGFVFTLRGATLDQSDEFTPATARFPEGYGVEADETVRNLWKGVAITEASVTLPGFFSKPGSTASMNFFSIEKPFK